MYSHSCTPAGFIVSVSRSSFSQSTHPPSTLPWLRINGVWRGVNTKLAADADAGWRSLRDLTAADSGRMLKEN